MELPVGGAIALAVAALLAFPTAGPAAAGSDPGGRRTVTLGRSVRGRPIVAIETGDFDSARRTLLVGCIHGNEPAGIAIARRLGMGPLAFLGVAGALDSRSRTNSASIIGPRPRTSPTIGQRAFHPPITSRITSPSRRACARKAG